MKKSHFKIFFWSSIILFGVGCATKKAPVVVKPEVKIQEPTPVVSNFDDNFDSEIQKKWVDSVYNALTFDERIGQLFMVSAYSNKDSVHVKAIDKLIQENKVGGLIFFQGGPVRQAKLTNRFQSKAKVPLLIGIILST